MWKEMDHKNLVVQSSYGTKIRNTWTFFSSNKTDFVLKLSKAFSGLVVWTFKINMKKLSFCSHFLRDLLFFQYQECHFNDYFMRFYHFWHYLTFWYSHQHVLISKLIQSCQSWFRPSNQRWVNCVYCWKPKVSELRKSALNSADSELILFEKALFGAEFFKS